MTFALSSSAPPPNYSVAYKLGKIMASTPTDTVLPWIDAVNAGDIERALELATPDVALVGPRGTSRGREVLRTWLSHAGATFVTRAIHAGDESVVVAQRGIWRDTATGAIVGESDVATRFRVAGGLIAEIQRYEDLAGALRDAKLANPAISASSSNDAS